METSSLPLLQPEAPAAERVRLVRRARLLVGLGANALVGWWWADPVTAFAIAAVAIREGRSAWRGDACCASC
jgi:hypothetical protein